MSPEDVLTLSAFLNVKSQVLSYYYSQILYSVQSLNSDAIRTSGQILVRLTVFFKQSYPGMWGADVLHLNGDFS